MYEPYVTALAQSLRLSLPAWRAADHELDDWRTSAWDTSGELPKFKLDDDDHL
jgi:hypothetical protein